MKEETKSGAMGMVCSQKKVVVYSLVSLLVGLLVGWIIFSPARPATETGENEVSATPLVLSGKNVVSVDDQLPGTTVTIQSVTLENAGWVAIHEDRDGKPGNILGASWFPAGTNSGSVELLRTTTDGGTYYAMMHNDDGNKLFDYKVDMPLTDESGNPLMVKFMTTATPAAQQ
ncbi:MAG: hypothetical protein WCW78_00650 [Candidatus Paceibacterota bacterium]|jgi:hypothetical protein